MKSQQGASLVQCEAAPFLEMALEVAATEAFVKAELQKLGPDGSHDWWHIHRVRNLALSMAQQEGLQVRCSTSAPPWRRSGARVKPPAAVHRQARWS